MTSFPTSEVESVITLTSILKPTHYILTLTKLDTTVLTLFKNNNSYRSYFKSASQVNGVSEMCFKIGASAKERERNVWKE